MLNDLGALPWDTIGLSGVATILTVTLVRMVVSGNFVPREQVDMLLSDLRARVAWMEKASETREETMRDLVAQNAKLSVQGDISVRVLQSLQQPILPSNASPGSGHVASTQE